MIHVCSLARLHRTVEDTAARHVVTLIRDVDLVRRPPGIEEKNHLIIDVDDIVSPIDGHTHPNAEHVERLIDFAQQWDRAAPLVIHCYAGISRSTAGAFTVACALNPEREERVIAQAIRRASATATPNALIVALADRALARNGRMVGAIESIGRGRIAFEGEPFRLDLA
jgi:predicted protein tyrosine phosphatase